MAFLDANLKLGRGWQPARFDTTSVGKALELLDFFAIEKALVRVELQEG